MAFDPDQFLAQTEASTTTSSPGGFDPDKFLNETEPKSISGFAHNAWQDAKDTVGGVASLGKGLLTHPVDTAANVLTNLPKAVVNEGKRIGLGGEGGLLHEGIHPLDAINKFGNALYEKPLTTSLDVAPVVGAAGKALGIGGEAAKGAEMASEAAQATEKGAGIADELSSVTPRVETTSSGTAQAAKGAEETIPTGATFQDTVANLSKKIPGEIKEPLGKVGDYLESKYSQAASKPGWKDIVADYMKEHSQNMTLKELGAAPGQVRKIGVEKARALADYASENGLAGPKVGTIGREKLIPQRLEEAGGAVGAFRKMAADRGAAMNTDDLVNQVRSKLDDKYLTGGLQSGEKGTYMKALVELKKSGGRADDLANTVSDLFKESKNLDRLKRPSGPVADVAREVREINHQEISQKLSPQEMALYERGLEDYGALTQINEFVKRRGSVEAGGRLGPGSGISRAAVQKFLDAVGYRTEAKIMRNLSEKIRANPEILSTPKNMFRSYIDEATEAVDDMTDIGH